MLLQPPKRLVQVVAHVLVGLVEQKLPAGLLRDVEGLPVPVLHIGDLAGGGLALAAGHLVGDHLLKALLEHVRATLQEQHAEDVLLEFGGVHLAAQDIGGTEEVAF